VTPTAAAAARTAPGHARPATRPRPRPRAVPAPRGRRVSGPAQPRRDAARPATIRAGSTLLDRLIHGRLWIVIIAGALVGLVFLQVSLLKLNSGIGRAVQTAATLERQNAGLRAEVSRLDSGERVQSVAARLGLVMPAPGDRRYLQAGGAAYAAQAARVLTTPEPVVQQPLEPDPTALDPHGSGVAQVAATTAPPAATHPPADATGGHAPAGGTSAPAQTQAAPPAQQAAPPPEQAEPAGQTPTGEPEGTSSGASAGAVSAPAASAPPPG